MSVTQTKLSQEVSPTKLSTKGTPLDSTSRVGSFHWTGKLCDTSPWLYLLTYFRCSDSRVCRNGQNQDLLSKKNTCPVCRYSYTGTLGLSVNRITSYSCQCTWTVVSRCWTCCCCYHPINYRIRDLYGSSTCGFVCMVRMWWRILSHFPMGFVIRPRWLSCTGLSI